MKKTKVNLIANNSEDIFEHEKKITFLLSDTERVIKIY